MKKIIILILILMLNTVMKLAAQNVGIGTATPAFKLDVKNGSINTDSVYRIGGNTVLSVHGAENIFAGFGSGITNTTGFRNTSVGYGCLFSNTIGSGNAAYGSHALYFNSTGNDNTATGKFALRFNTTGSGNTANGVFSLYANTTGSSNTAFGASALGANTSGHYNLAVGERSLFSNTTGFSNVAIGVASLYGNAAIGNLVAIGDSALFNNGAGATGINGTNNTAVGSKAMYSNTTGHGNTAVGFQALYFNKDGFANTAVGEQALFKTLTTANTALGTNAGNSFNLGPGNILIGSASDGNADFLSGSIAIGTTVTASNQARIGNNSMLSIGGFTGWSNISDGRVKRNITDNVPGLSFINTLKPVTYNLDLDAVDGIIQPPVKKDMAGNIIRLMPVEIAARKQKEQIVYTGFIAQDVEKAAKDLGYDFSGVDAAKNDKDLYGLRYAEFVVPLVKAVQEQQQMINNMQKKIALVEEQNKILLEMLKNKN